MLEFTHMVISYFKKNISNITGVVNPQCYFLENDNPKNKTFKKEKKSSWELAIEGGPWDR
jgi:hypothetical protein